MIRGGMSCPVHSGRWKVRGWMAPVAKELNHIAGNASDTNGFEDTGYGFDAIGNGDADELAENSFAYVGTIDEAIDKDKKAAA